MRKSAKKLTLWALLALLMPYSSVFGQKALLGVDLNQRELRWTAPISTQFTETETKTFLWFDGASYDAAKDFLPLFTERRQLAEGSTAATAQILNPQYQPLDNASLAVIGFNSAYLAAEPVVTVKIAISRRVPFANISILPLRRNPSTGIIEKLVSFSLQVTGNSSARRLSISNAFVSSSVLATGTWHRIGVTNTGIYKLDYNFLSNMGIDMTSLDPRNIRLYGNGHGQLPLSNNGQHQDDLKEYAISVIGETDGTFDASDYVLFYGTSPNSWTFDSTDMHYHHHVHNYSDTTYYFINTDLGTGKRIQTQASSSLSPNKTVTAFDDYQFHEFDNENMIKSGREWYGEKFDILNSYSFGFSFPNIVDTSTACVEVDLISRCDFQNYYTVTAQSNSATISVPSTSSSCYYCPYANPAGTSLCFNPTGPVITVGITRQTTLNVPVGWLNWVRVNARRQLKMSGSQMSFRDRRSAGMGNVAQYILDGYSPSLAVWDVTDLSNVALQAVTPNASTLQWTLPADSVREFISFDGSNYFTATNFGEVPNQNLHALQPVDYIIIAHPDFLAEANDLAEFHAVHDGLSYLIVTPQQIYNEFSSGAQDITAIRDFVRMIYSRATTANLPRYLLLFGDGSYDNKHRLPGNTNFIPTFQNLNSVGPTESYVSDEYYGLLDDAGGWDDGSDVGAVDIGIGRLPVQSTDQAKSMVEKIKHYSTRQAPVINVSACSNDQCSQGGEWRNWITFIGDDEDADIHMSQADQLATYIDTGYDNYNIDKIYLDAYQQQQTPGGERYPDVNDAFDKRVGKGSLIINYTGHGGEVGLAHERILEVSQINSWTNICNLPLFVTATCEFSRFDDPSRTSAGEDILLNAGGGGIGLLTTVRLVYSTPNFNLNKKFYENAFDPLPNGEMPRVGDLYRLTKVASGNNTNNRNFTLLGDPAVRLNYPENNVVTTEINNVPVTSTSSDTLRALSRITIKGEVRDTMGNKMTGFNGVLYPTVFDKPKTITTLANDPPNQPFTFKLQKSVLYHGKVSVVNGDFQFSFVVPKDISYQYGGGRISYYAEDGQTDASGNYENIVIGGSNSSAPVDVTGPTLKLFLNDSNFVSGGITNASPKLFAIVRDSNGVNTVGNGIGHDVVAILDEQTDNAIVLNDYYQADMNSYQSGKIIYPFENLSVGTHTLSLKVWDVYNNSSTVKTEFVVTNPSGLSLDHVINYPNPFTTNTSFFIEYNQCCTEYDVMIQVFTVSGKLVKTINEHVLSEGFRSDPIEWDGRDDYGDRIGRGVYIYRTFVRANDGKTAEKYEKLVILE